jgi:hypothetical protein
VVKTQLSWPDAQENAEKILKNGKLTRTQHMEIFRKYLESGLTQDKKIAIALLELFIKTYPDEFDQFISLDDIAYWGEKAGAELWKEYGKSVIFPIIRSRSIPAQWIDLISDESKTTVRKSFAIALGELAKKKSVKLERILGMLEYFLDEPDKDVRNLLLVVFEQVDQRDPERLHYFMTEFERGAGSFRLALFKTAREKIAQEHAISDGQADGEQSQVKVKTAPSTTAKNKK